MTKIFTCESVKQTDISDFYPHITIIVNSLSLFLQSYLTFIVGVLLRHHNHQRVPHWLCLNDLEQLRILMRHANCSNKVRFVLQFPECLKELSCTRDAKFVTVYNRILTIKWKRKLREIVILKTEENWCCQSKMCYIQIDIRHAYMFQYIQNIQNN